MAFFWTQYFHTRNGYREKNTFVLNVDRYVSIIQACHITKIIEASQIFDNLFVEIATTVLYKYL